MAKETAVHRLGRPMWTQGTTYRWRRSEHPGTQEIEAHEVLGSPGSRS